MKIVVCEKLDAKKGKVCITDSICPFCNQPISEHKEIEEENHGPEEATAA